jgi:hypothetical protein
MFFIHTLLTPFAAKSTTSNDTSVRKPFSSNLIFPVIPFASNYFEKTKKYRCIQKNSHKISSDFLAVRKRLRNSFFGDICSLAILHVDHTKV